MQRRPIEVPVRKVDQMIFNPVRRDRGKPKRILGEIIKRDLKINGIIENLIWNRKQ